jgi:hypothetical protein
LGEQSAAVREADGDAPAVHQSGPRRLWDIFDDIATAGYEKGSLPVYGATVTITPDGICYPKRGR